MIFLGGFFFHLIWEAKSQYTVIYFFLLIPYAVNGYDQVSKSLARFLTQPSGSALSKWRAGLKQPAGLCFAILFFVTVVFSACSMGEIVSVKGDNEKYAAYLSQYMEERNQRLSDG